jgi:hypothetical protein
MSNHREAKDDALGSHGYPDVEAQWTAQSSDVMIKPSSKRFSIQLRVKT